MIKEFEKTIKYTNPYKDLPNISIKIDKIIRDKKHERAIQKLHSKKFK